MKHIFECVNAHQAAALWISVAFMVSLSAFALLGAFNRLT
jgi:hypothetical protein